MKNWRNWRRKVPDFADIASEYEKIKDTPDVTATLRTNQEYKATGKAADLLEKRQKYLPDASTHYKLQDKLSKMFDKSSRAGAKSTLGGLVMPSGQKIFREFHDNYTGTGRFKPQKAPDKVAFKEDGPKIDPYPNRVILYERCMDCLERVDLNNFIPDMTFVPPGEHLNPIAAEKWRSVDIKPETLICYFFCMKCPTERAKKLRAIKHDPIKSKFIIGMGPDGKPMTMADKECQAFLAEHAGRISDNVHQQIKYHRNLKSNDIFWGNARID
jgi:hypothetical protein